MTTRCNTLFYGDNLEVLRKHIPDESISLIYLDPPFNSKADYNVLFREPTGEESVAQTTHSTNTFRLSDATVSLLRAGGPFITRREPTRHGTTG